MARNVRSKVIYKGTFISDQSLPNQDFSNTIGAINHILKNGTRIDLKVDKLYDGSDSNAFIMHYIQLAPFSRRFFENVKNVKYTKFV